MPDENKEINLVANGHDFNDQNGDDQENCNQKVLAYDSNDKDSFSTVSVPDYTHADEDKVTCNVCDALDDADEKFEVTFAYLVAFADALDEAYSAVKYLVSVRELCVQDPAVREYAIIAAGKLASIASVASSECAALAASITTLSSVAADAADETCDAADFNLAIRAADSIANSSALVSQSPAAFAVASTYIAHIASAAGTADEAVAEAFYTAIQTTTLAASTLEDSPQDDILVSHVKSGLNSNSLFASQNNSAYPAEDYDKDNGVASHHQ